MGAFAPHIATPEIEQKPDTKISFSEKKEQFFFETE
jgi:hypothetical protein